MNNSNATPPSVAPVNPPKSTSIVGSAASKSFDKATEKALSLVMEGKFEEAQIIIDELSEIVKRDDEIAYLDKICKAKPVKSDPKNVIKRLSQSYPDVVKDEPAAKAVATTKSVGDRFTAWLQNKKP